MELLASRGISKISVEDYQQGLKVVMGKDHLFISPIELQIPYRLYLGSDKDIEDAVYLWDIFKENIDF